MRFSWRLELLQEAEVGFVEQANVVYVVLEHRHALDAESSRIAVPLGRVDAAVAEHLGVDHPAAPHLEPAFVPAALAPHSIADSARHVEFEARLGEGEVARPHAHLALDPIQRLDHVQERAFHVTDGQGLVDRQAFDLAEIRKERRVRRTSTPGVAPRAPGAAWPAPLGWLSLPRWPPGRAEPAPQARAGLCPTAGC